MAISLVGKIVILAVSLAVIGGLTAVIVIVVNDGSTTESVETTPSPTTPGLDEVPGSDLPYEVGVGIADMTGPCVEIAFMGYAEVSQTGRGIHTRQFSRAFIFKQGDSRVVLVTAEVQSIGIAVRREVVKNLQELYGDIYTLRNVILTGTHTHSAPGGYLVDFLLDVSILGFSRETFNAYVDGITRSIVRAHENTVGARLFFSQSTVENAQKNRSPYSYDYNPEREKEMYPGNTDDTLTQVRIVKSDGTLHGVLSWFALHTTSMNMTNQLISSDNLGYSALKMEQELNPGTLPGKPSIVAGFFSSNLGDVSPNLQDSVCEFSGRPCDNQFVICQLGERCFAQGPGEDMFDSTRIIGQAVFEGAMRALHSEGEELTGDVSVVHQFVEMGNEVVFKYDARAGNFTDIEVRGCVPAMGYSFASGTTDGANTLNITQGTMEGNALLELVGGLVGQPTDDDIDCHSPKPILLATGRANFPLPWHPHIISLSAVNLAGLLVLGVPGEPTTMSGRRMREVAQGVLEELGEESRVVVSGLTNEYIHYVATYEEYQIQRYEAASTIYGPHTLDIMLNKFAEFTRVAIEGGSVPPGPEPADNIGSTLSLITPVVFDRSPSGTSFGDVLVHPPPTARRGDIVYATFVGANPRNDLKQEDSHAVVERFEVGQWAVFATDADWSTKFYWERTSLLTGTSEVRFEWQIPADAVLTLYRLVYRGTARSIRGTLTNFTGTTFMITVQEFPKNKSKPEIERGKCSACIHIKVVCCDDFILGYTRNMLKTDVVVFPKVLRKIVLVVRKIISRKDQHQK